MEKIKKILIIILIAVSAVEIVSIAVRGKWLNDKKYLPAVKSILYTGKNIDRIIYGMGKPFISKTHISFLTEYAIDGMGIVPRWTEMHRVIEKWVDSANDAEFKKLITKPTTP